MPDEEADARRPERPALGAVVGVFARDRLSGGLVATHRAGYGPHARVLDGARGELMGQLRRAGLAIPLDPGEDAATALIVVTAPGRAAAVRDLLARAGASAVHVATRPDAAAPFADAPPVVDTVPPAENGASR